MDVRVDSYNRALSGTPQYHTGIRLDGVEKTTENLSLVSSKLTKIRTVYPPNTNVERYRYTNLLCIQSFSDPRNQEQVQFWEWRFPKQ
jgi:hypothetical protein